jgi:hypothetical protein
LCQRSSIFHCWALQPHLWQRIFLGVLPSILVQVAESSDKCWFFNLTYSYVLLCACFIIQGFYLTSDIIVGKLELASVSSALILASGIGIMEALALFLGSGLFLKLMGVSPVCLNYDSYFHAFTSCYRE